MNLLMKVTDLVKRKFSNIVEVLGDTSIGGGVCSLSNLSKDISLLA